MKKQVVSGVMVLSLLAALCGCGKKAENTSTAAAAPAPTATQAAATAESTAEAAASQTQEASNTPSGTPASGGSVVFGMTQDLASLDPHANSDAGTRDVVFNLYEGLVKPTSGGEMIPAVAEDYSISDDAKVYTFTLRDGIKFQDGTEVTVQDVKYSIDRYAENQGDSSAFSVVKEVKIVDDKTVELDLEESYAELLPLLDVAIIPESNPDPAANPIGTGPFGFVSYTPGEKLVLKKNQYYWQEGLPYLDEVTFKFAANVDAAFTELQGGTIDILKYLTDAQVKALAKNPSYNIVEGSMNLVQALFLNNAAEPLSNEKVRQAIYCGINRDAINDFIFAGKSHVIGTHMIPAMAFYYNEATENTYPFDQAHAKELLVEAGYPDGFELEITVPSAYSQHVDTAQIIADQLSQIGIRVKISQVEWNDWKENTYKGRKFQSTVIGFDGTLAPASWLQKYTTSAGNNFINYDNPEYDKTFEEAYNTSDMNEKAELYKKCEQILADTAASVYIQDPANLVAVNKKFAGYTSYPCAAEDMAVLYMVSP